jgi:hypothetical protein
MPYTLTKGPLLTLLENTLNPRGPQEIDTRNDALRALRNGDDITSVPWVTSPAVGSVAVPQDPLSIRLDRDWFGKVRNGPSWDPQPPFSGQTTGYWVGYYGLVEEVLREGVIRTMEVSLGITREEDPEEARRHWPVDVNWKCPNPYFEVWVTWRRHHAEPSQGQVNMLIATPPDKSNRLVTRPTFPPPPKPPRVPVATPLDPPVRADGPQGMWLITRDNHVQHTVDQKVRFAGGRHELEEPLRDEVAALLGLAPDQWAIPMPSTFWEDQGDVVVVAPPDYAGGADPNRSNAP